MSDQSLDKIVNTENALLYIRQLSQLKSDIFEEVPSEKDLQVIAAIDANIEELKNIVLEINAD